MQLRFLISVEPTDYSSVVQHRRWSYGLTPYSVFGSLTGYKQYGVDEDRLMRLYRTAQFPSWKLYAELANFHVLLLS